jgi:hypothetical protein
MGRIERRDLGRDRRDEPERERRGAEHPENQEEREEPKLADPPPAPRLRLGTASTEGQNRRSLAMSPAG